MNSVKASMEKDQRALDEAEAWFARRLAHDDSDSQQFEKWLRENPAHASAWQKTQALWDHMGDWVQDEALADYAREAFEAEHTTSSAGHRERDIATRHRRTSLRRHLKYAAAAAAIVATVTIGLGIGRTRSQVYTTDIQVADIQLSDGSTVRLDAGSRLEASMSWWRRNVHLLQGRALFDVTHDASRPFIVDADAGRITVLGTSFEVDRRTDDVVVTLLRGSVSIDTPGDPVPTKLRPGEQARWQAEAKHWSQRGVDVAAATRWTTGFHVFDAMPLSQAVAEINRYSARKIRLADSSLSALELNGNFHLGDAGGIANALPYVLPVKVRDEGAEIIVSHR